MWQIKQLGFLFPGKLAIGVATFFIGMSTSFSVLHADIVVELSPHRAVYDLSLDKATDRSGITSISSRLVYELKGSYCEGYTLNIRLVSNLGTKSGRKNVTDVRISSFEGEESSSLHYTSQQYLNKVQTQKFRGQAEKRKGVIKAKQEEPTPKTNDLPKTTLFPNEYIVKLLKSALEGKSLTQSYYFDGSDGLHPFRVSAIIGKHKVPGSISFKNDVPALARLKVLSSWPIIMSYFKTSKSNSGEQTPVYEMSTHMFENGVSSAIKLTYRDFSMKGDLVDLEFYPPAKCD